MAWRRDGEDYVCEGPGPCRVRAGSRTVLYYPGERLTAQQVAELGVEVEVEEEVQEDER